MPLNVDTRSSLRSSAQLDDLVAAIYESSADTQETRWVGWKRALDFDSAHGKFTAAKAIIALANRDPANAARTCGGEAYLVVGVCPGGVIDSVEVRDAAVLHDKLKTFVDGPHFDVDYVEAHGKTVLIITVAPPEPGHRIHSLVKEFDKYRSGTVFVRGVASSEPATHRELNALQDRLLSGTPPSATDEFITALGGSNPAVLGKLMRRTTADLIAEYRDTDRYPATFISRTPTERLRQYVQVADRYQAAAVLVVERVAEGCRLEDRSHERFWRDAVTALAEPRTFPQNPGTLMMQGRDDALEALALLPATLTMYAGTIAAVDCENYGAVRALTTDGAASASFFHPERKVPIIDKVGPWEFVAHQRELALALRAAQKDDLTEELLDTLSRGGQPRRATYPASAYLFDALLPCFPGHPASRYTELFDSAEILFSLIVADQQAQQRHGYIEGPWLGLFVTHAAETASLEGSHFGQFVSDFAEAGDNWKPLQAGMFGGSFERCRTAAQVVWNSASEQYRRGPF